jgi:hypothetical protein
MSSPRRFPPPWSVEELDNERRGLLHPRLVRGRSLETEPHVNIAYSGSLVCSVMNTQVLNLVSTVPALS